MNTSWKRHFDKSNFMLEHCNPSRFASGPWHSGIGPPVHIVFLIYRILLSSAFTGLVIWSLALNWDEGKWLAYLTNWGFTICCIQSYFGLGIALNRYLKQNTLSPDSSTSDLKSEKEYMPVVFKMYWVAYNTATAVAFFITILYWSILYSPEKEILRGGFPLNFTVHGLNSILSLLDIIVGGPPSRFLHAYQPVLFALIYITFNLIYWAAGGKGRGGTSFIYPVLDWDNKPWLGVGIVFGGALLLLILHTFICLLAGARSRISNKRKSRVINNLGIVTPPDLEGGNINKAFVI